MPSTAPTRSAALWPEVDALVAEQDGVLARAQLADLGVGRNDIAAQVRALRWRVVGLAVVVHRGSLTLRERQWVAVVQTRGRGGLAAWSALEADGLAGWARHEVHVVVPRGWTVQRVPGLVVHESRRFEPASDLIRRGGPPRTSVSRSAVDAGAWSRTTRAAAGVLAATAQQRLCRPDEMRAALERAGRVRHAAAMREALSDIGAGAQSVAEMDMGTLLRAAGLPAPRRQSERVDGSGRRRYVDLEVDLPDGTVLQIEVDGAHHLDVRQAWEDQQRQNDLVAPGRVLLRFPTYALRHERPAVARQLRRVRRAHTPRRVVSQNGAHAPRIR